MENYYLSTYCAPDAIQGCEWTDMNPSSDLKSPTEIGEVTSTHN